MALEVAQQLQRAGEVVESLIIIDAPIDNTNIVVRGVDRVIRAAGVIGRWDSGTRLERFLTVRRWLERLDGVLPRRSTVRDSPTLPAGDPIAHAYQRARRGYVPRRYSGRLLLLKRAGHALDSRWLKISRGLTVAEIAGTHETCLTDDLPTICAHFERAVNDGHPEADVTAPLIRANPRPLAELQVGGSAG